MKKTLYSSVVEVGKANPDFMIVVPDLGSFSEFREAFPERYINVGVTESNSVSISAGLASQGKTVLLYSVAGFTVYRGFEQIKFAVGYWNQAVHIIGSGFGWRFYQVGRGHHPIDDIKLMQAIPNLTVYTPATSTSLRAILQNLSRTPSYIRIGEQNIPNLPIQQSFEQPDLIVFALGELVFQCDKVAQLFPSAKIETIAVEDFSVETKQMMIQSCQRSNNIIVVEDHGQSGGLGEVLYQAFISFEHIHLPLNVETITRTREELLDVYGFSIQKLAARYATILGIDRPSDHVDSHA